MSPWLQLGLDLACVLVGCGLGVLVLRIAWPQSLAGPGAYLGATLAILMVLAMGLRYFFM